MYQINHRGLHDSSLGGEQRQRKVTEWDWMGLEIGGTRIVQGILPDIILLTLCYYNRGTNPIKCQRHKIFQERLEANALVA